MNGPSLRLHPASRTDISLLQSLARRIWHACYPGIISPEQIEYMLGWMYATAQLEGEMERKETAFFLLRLSDRDVGFAAIGTGEDPDELHLHKLYLLPEVQGQGFGSQALTQLKDLARERGARRLSLRVNRRNLPAIRCYERNGFRIERQIVATIGEGFVMDDHWMSALL